MSKENAEATRNGTPVYICFPARKGGVGKTMLAGNTAGFLANEGYRVLLVGADSQEDVSEKYLSPLEDFDLDEHLTLSDILDGTIAVEDAIVSTPKYKKFRFSEKTGKLRRIYTGNTYTFDIIPAGTDIDSRGGDELDVIREYFSGIEENYDYILFDTPPAETESFMLVLMACDYAVIPVTDRASFKSVKNVLDDIELARDNGSRVRCLGIVVNNQHSTRSLDKFNEGIFRESLDGAVFDTVIRSSSIIPNADAFSLPVCSYMTKEGSCEDLYRYFCELNERISSMEKEI